MTRKEQHKERKRANKGNYWWRPLIVGEMNFSEPIVSLTRFLDKRLRIHRFMFVECCNDVGRHVKVEED